MTHVIMEPCVGVKDTSCVAVCPVDCIYGANEDWPLLVIQSNECIDCGLCVDVCPVQAIAPLAEVPEEMVDFVVKTYEEYGFPLPPTAT